MLGLSEYEAGNGTAADGPHGTTNERFLSSVSAFIRRCFEYADPDHPQNQEESTEAKSDENAFDIGEDSDAEEDLLDLGSPKKETRQGKKSTGLDSLPPPSNNPDNKDRQRSISRGEAANAALDPSKPLHITLPTFRMVVLADELLEQFFESSFPASFRISDKMIPATVASSSPLTTFSNLGSFVRSPTITSSSGLGAAGGVVPPGKGLRGVLDNIVTDGMRVAAEVRRRMDEAQKELEKNAVQRPEEEEDEDEGYDGARPSVGDAERRSVRSEDLDLLEGADAEAGSVKGQDAVEQVAPVEKTAGRERSASSATQKVVEFER